MDTPGQHPSNLLPFSLGISRCPRAPDSGTFQVIRGQAGGTKANSSWGFWGQMNQFGECTVRLFSGALQPFSVGEGHRVADASHTVIPMLLHRAWWLCPAWALPKVCLAQTPCWPGTQPGINLLLVCARLQGFLEYGGYPSLPLPWVPWLGCCAGSQSGYILESPVYVVKIGVRLWALGHNLVFQIVHWGCCLYNPRASSQTHRNPNPNYLLQVLLGNLTQVLRPDKRIFQWFPCPS